ncbi:unnamed protein product [Nesidiocoris tenuis]|uniref:Uncharacterized protein n=1 Tax=Nesidiocoris tenuis TaxID=355587 RepID=A0A6H5H2F6_9HEMI|nr:unnamed protein product [Nesidiocoris tenuis]
MVRVSLRKFRASCWVAPGTTSDNINLLGRILCTRMFLYLQHFKPVRSCGEDSRLPDEGGIVSSETLAKDSPPSLFFRLPTPGRTQPPPAPAPATYTLLHPATTPPPPPPRGGAPTAPVLLAVSVPRVPSDGACNPITSRRRSLFQPTGIRRVPTVAISNCWRHENSNASRR